MLVIGSALLKKTQMINIGIKPSHLPGLSQESGALFADGLRLVQRPSAN